NSHDEEKGGAASGRALGPDAAAMTLKDALHDRKANTGALELLARMQSLEHPEQVVGVFHVEAGTVVADEVDPLGRVCALCRCDVLYDRADRYTRIRNLARELESVREQVDENLLEQRRIPLAAGQLFELYFDGAFGLARAQI